MYESNRKEYIKLYVYYLFRFLLKHGILGEYCDEYIKNRNFDRQKVSYSEIRRSITRHLKEYNDFDDVSFYIVFSDFSSAAISFGWARSTKGSEYWRDYNDKFCIYFNEIKTKFL